MWNFNPVLGRSPNPETSPSFSSTSVLSQLGLGLGGCCVADEDKSSKETKELFGKDSKEKIDIATKEVVELPNKARDEVTFLNNFVEFVEKNPHEVLEAMQLHNKARNKIIALTVWTTSPTVLTADDQSEKEKNDPQEKDEGVQSYTKAQNDSTKLTVLTISSNPNGQVKEEIDDPQEIVEGVQLLHNEAPAEIILQTVSMSLSTVSAGSNIEKEKDDPQEAIEAVRLHNEAQNDSSSIARTVSTENNIVPAVTVMACSQNESIAPIVLANSPTVSTNSSKLDGELDDPHETIEAVEAQNNNITPTVSASSPTLLTVSSKSDRQIEEETNDHEAIEAVQNKYTAFLKSHQQYL